MQGMRTKRSTSRVAGPDATVVSLSLKGSRNLRLR